ncbi:Restriction endonuclease S subunit [Hoeflea phototrophica DFL-43]|uniref:Restriction endonuclease S subunit n=1 Tax=Hoeflea phototrophica (strain DSM 17068 / NCIMB 14078 / DFL-43) TaxID=411684 RepID=A9DFL1_HOEPD|nr:restriction endonuclease subunit S [Hoeflea phototrophica]EDQ31787.1 Restriction endonuclease S subunit [Hoeflea phototrophica DFL-43]
MSREVAEGWRPTTFSDIASDVSARNRSRDEIPVLSVTKYDGFVPSEEYFKKKVFSADTENYKIVRRGQFAYATIHLDEGSIDRLTRFDVGLISPMYTVFEIDERQADPDFILRLFKFYAMNGQFDALGNGGVNRRKSISFSTLGKLSIPLPPLHEQRRIAEILSSVDEAIAATRAVIEQTRKVKQGVMERLLTKGIGHTRFKQTESGEIPEGWKVATLEELLADITNPMRSGPFGSALKSEELVDSGVPFLGIDNIQVEQFVCNYKRFLSEDKFRQLRRFAVNPNDVVITIMGTVGRCCVIPPDIGEAVSSKHIWAMSLHHEKYIPELACWQMNFAPWIVSKFTTSAQGGIMSAINSGILRKLVFPVPGLEEQRRILQVWQSFQSELQVEQAKLHNLESLKSDLMSDLLTGRKRVADTLPMAAE